MAMVEVAVAAEEEEADLEVSEAPEAIGPQSDLMLHSIFETVSLVRSYLCILISTAALSSALSSRRSTVEEKEEEAGEGGGDWDFDEPLYSRTVHVLPKRMS